MYHASLCRIQSKNSVLISIFGCLLLAAMAGDDVTAPPANIVFPRSIHYIILTDYTS